MLIEASRYEDLIVVRPDIEWQFECAYQTGPFQYHRLHRLPSIGLSLIFNET